MRPRAGMALARGSPVCYLASVRYRLMLRSARLRRLTAWAALFVMTASLPSGEASAHGSGERALATLPPAPPGDGAKAEQILREIAERTQPQHPSGDPSAGPAGAEGQAVPRAPGAAAEAGSATAKVVAEPVAQAKRALARAHGARAAGDAAHARMLDALALEWAETARELLRAAAAETTAAEAARRAREVATQLERARALLEETQARRGRAAAELERLETLSREAAQAAATAEQERIEAGRRGGAKAPKRGAPTRADDAGKPRGKGGAP
jgi:hypothetical protein